MSTELEVQKHLIDEVRNNLHGFAFKAANRFLVGVVDLFVQLPDHLGMWIEVKFKRGARQQATLNLSQHQSRFLNNINRAGGCGGWVMAIDHGHGLHSLCSGYEYETPSGALHLTPNNADWYSRGRGNGWPVKELVANIERMRHDWLEDNNHKKEDGDVDRILRGRCHR